MKFLGKKVVGNRSAINLPTNSTLIGATEPRINTPFDLSRFEKGPLSNGYKNKLHHPL